MSMDRGEMKLEPCKFCDSTAYSDRDRDQGYFIACHACGARGPLAESLDVAVKSWNASAAPADATATEKAAAIVERAWRQTCAGPKEFNDYAIPLIAAALRASAAPEEGEIAKFINARLEDLAQANALYGKDQRLEAPNKIDRNNREISWLKDLRSMLALSPDSRKAEPVAGCSCPFDGCAPCPACAVLTPATEDGTRATLRKLVDIVWNEATESTAVPSTKWADKLIDRALSPSPSVGTPAQPSADRKAGA